MAVAISESSWKAFTKKQKLDVELEDKDLLKALARFDKTDERKPEPRLEALKDLVKEIPKQVTALVKVKKKLGDKPFGLIKDELYGILEAAEALQKKTQAELDSEGDEDEDSVPSALVDPKLLLRQLTMCRKDPERTVKFAFVDAKGKEQPAMLALHPRMGARALFVKLQAAAGVKTGAYGSAWVDGTSLMLQLDKPLSGLVKKVRPPVKACGFKIAKAVLWNEDGTVFEQDELPEEAVGENVAQAAQGAAGAPAEQNKGAPNAPPQPSVTYETKLAALLPRVKKAAGEGSPDATTHQKLLEFAAGKAGGKDFLGAVAALRQIEQLLDKPTPKTAGSGNGEAGVAFKARLTALIPKIKEAQTTGRPGAQDAKLKANEAGVLAGKREFERATALLDEAQALLAPRFDEVAFRAAWKEVRDGWQDAIETVDGQIAKLQVVLRDNLDEDLQEIAEFGLPALTGNFKAPMMAAVMDVDRASGDALPKAARRASELASSFADYLDEAQTVAVTDDNDFGVTVTIRKTIGGALRQLEMTLAPAAA